MNESKQAYLIFSTGFTPDRKSAMVPPRGERRIA
jgi:hypothetical protein